MKTAAGWHAFDHYAYALVAVAGTGAAIVILALAMQAPGLAGTVAALAGVAAPFVNIVGLLFGLTLAFLSNDTWTAHDRARSAVLREADAIRGLDILASALPDPARDGLRAALAAYAAESAAEWPALARCTTRAGARAAADQLLTLAAAPGAAAAGSTVQQRMLTEIAAIREARDTRIGLSRTHVNPLKWLAMAFLGFLTMVSVAVIHAGDPQAALVAMVLFGLAAAPTAAIVLVHGNPFQPPSAVGPALIAEALAGRPGAGA